MYKLVVFLGFHKTGSSFLRECFKISNCKYLGKPFVENQNIGDEIDNLVKNNTSSIRFQTDQLDKNRVNVISEEFILSRYSENPNLFSKIGIKSFNHLIKILNEAIDNPNNNHFPILQSLDFKLWIKNLKEMLDQDQLLILDYEYLKKDKNNFLKKISDFSGFEVRDYGFGEINKSKKDKNFRYVPKEFNGYFFNFVQRFKFLFPNKIRKNLKNKFLIMQSWINPISSNYDLKKINKFLRDNYKKEIYQFDAVFLDRDGVINYDYGYVGTLNRFKFCEGAIEALKILQFSGCKLFIITNQSGIYRGYYTLEDFKVVMNYLKNELAKNEVYIIDYKFCPHGPSQNCKCRKPKPKMILDLAKEHEINVEKSLMIGDNYSDIESGFAAGIKKKILIGQKDEKSNIKPDGQYSSLAEFVNDINK